MLLAWSIGNVIEAAVNLAAVDDFEIALLRRTQRHFIQWTLRRLGKAVFVPFLEYYLEQLESRFLVHQKLLVLIPNILRVVKNGPVMLPSDGL